MMSVFVNKPRWILSTVIAAGVVAAVTLFAAQPTAHGQNAAAALKVGTFDQQAVFQNFPASQELMTLYQDVQQQMDEARRAGDQQKIMQLQQAMETKRQEVVGDFQTAVDDALPAVADNAGVQVIALQVVYTSDDVEQTDLTQNLATAISEE